MEADLDTGPVIASEEIAIRDDDTAGSLASRLSEVGAALLIATNFNEATEVTVFAATLFVQGLPFLAAWLVAWLDRRAVVLRRALAPA